MTEKQMMKRDFAAGGGFAVWVPDVPEPSPQPEQPATATEAPADEDEEEVPHDGDCDGCVRRG